MVVFIHHFTRVRKTLDYYQTLFIFSLSCVVVVFYRLFSFKEISSTHPLNPALGLRFIPLPIIATKYVHPSEAIISTHMPVKSVAIVTMVQFLFFFFFFFLSFFLRGKHRALSVPCWMWA